MAKKFYRNLTGHVITVPLFGHGVVTIPANAECIELEESVANAISNMSSVKVLEETEPQLKLNPIAPPKKEEKKEEKPVAKPVAKKSTTPRKK